jgi:hypothetical protein
MAVFGVSRGFVEYWKRKYQNRNFHPLPHGGVRINNLTVDPEHFPLVVVLVKRHLLANPMYLHINV